VDKFLNTTNTLDKYYAYIRTNDGRQHRSGDILECSARLDEKLQAIDRPYKKREGRDLEIIISGSRKQPRGRRQG